jgi:anti-sigma28 factor (negative regulator of flagellin synthesis)
MMIKNTPSVGGIDPATSKTQTEVAASRRQADRVSTADAQRTAALVQSVQASVGMSHSAQLAQVEAQISAGTYRPSAGQLAARLLSAAEIDARLQAMLGG